MVLKIGQCCPSLLPTRFFFFECSTQYHYSQNHHLHRSTYHMNLRRMTSAQIQNNLSQCQICAAELQRQKRDLNGQGSVWGQTKYTFNPMPCLETQQRKKSKKIFRRWWCLERMRLGILYSSLLFWLHKSIFLGLRQIHLCSLRIQP